MTRAPRTNPSLRELLLRSDFGRANPHRVDELLARTLSDRLDTDSTTCHKQEIERVD